MANGYGFGHAPFGKFPFGKSNFGRNSYLRSFPTTYVQDENGNVNEFLKHYLEVAAHNANEIKGEIDRLDQQVDFNKVRSDLLTHLGTTLAVTLDDYEPDEFRRSLVGNAIQYYQRKGTRDAYRIRGKISGYDVLVFNIYRIEPLTLLKYGEDITVGGGNGSASQNFVGNLFTFPITPGTLVYKIDGVPVVEDDGAGGFTALGAYAPTGFVDYSTGDYDLTLTPAPPSATAITADYETAIADEFIATSTGAQTHFEHTIAFYPPFAGSMVLKANGVVFGMDDGNGFIVSSPGSPYPVMGTITPMSGFLVLNFLGPTIPALGEVITIDYEKTLLAEHLVNYVDDVYEIPTGSNHWFSTVAPGLIPGAAKHSQCGYCQTSYIKIRLTLVKSLSQNIPSSSENFFDRLIRKIREIVPIHVRDLLYELVLVITVDENQYLDADIGLQDISWWRPTSMLPRFDVVPADVMPTDSHGFVTGTVELA